MCERRGRLRWIRLRRRHALRQRLARLRGWWV